MAVTTLGRQLVKTILPLRYKSYADGLLTKSQILKLTTEIAKQDPEGYIDILHGLNAIGLRVVSVYGKDTTITLDDIDAGALVKNARKNLLQIIQTIINRKDLTTLQKLQKIIDLGYKYTSKLRLLGVLDAKKRKTGIANQMASGSRGNPVQLMQLITGDMMMKDAMNRDIPYIALMPYSDGDSPMAYYASAMSGRKSTYDVQAATGQVGYLSKQATNITHATPISTFDCGTTKTGIKVKAADNLNVGAVLLKPFKKHKAGSIVTLDMLALASDDDFMILRSATTCKAHNGVCALCSGLQLSGLLPAVGSYVALNAAKSFTEPLTQAGISSKHGSGVGGVKLIDPEGLDQPTGFASVLRMFSAPLVFPGGAVLALVGGRVNSITKAPQGGHYITVGNSTVYASNARTVLAKVGDIVLAGDMLTNGVPNPALVTHYKGLGLGRQYFVKKMYEILKKTGAGTHRRNVLQFTRAFLNKVKITKLDGFKGYYPGDVANYDDVVHDWLPRLGSKLKLLSKSIGEYLLLPIMEYTIGTLITPSVVKKLKLVDIHKGLVNPLSPPFLSVFVRSRQFTMQDKNWIPRLAGLRLKLSLFDAARSGITDLYNGPSFINKVISDPYKPTK